MPVSSHKESKSTFKHYIVNFLIIIFAVGSIFLIYNFISRITFQNPDAIQINKDKNLKIPQKKIYSQSLQIDIKNGCQTEGIESKFAEYLKANGFDVVGTSKFTASDIKKTFVIDRVGNSKNAKKIADALGISTRYIIEQKTNDDYLLDATVVIGNDYLKLTPFK